MLKDRVTWLGRPWFFAAVAVLVLNDHLFKPIWPGWVTGKLSDFAGLVVVAILAAVIAGPLRGTLVAGLAFIALKAVPGVAELAAPVLGGVTVRDASDLVALVALPPLWLLLRRELPGRSARTRRGWQAVGLVAAVLATTATSASPTDVVDRVGVEDGVFIASVPLSDGFGSRALRSADGGRTWSVSEHRSTTPDSIRIDDEGTITACSPEGYCYRVRRELESAPYNYRRVLERREAGSARWSHELFLRDGYAPRGLAVGTAERVIVQSGERTIRYRTSAGDWPEVDLVALASPPHWQVDAVHTLGTRDATLAFTVVLSLLGLILLPGAPARWFAQVMNLVVGGALYVAGWFFLGPARLAVFHLAWLVAGFAGMVIHRVVARSRSTGFDPR